MADRADFARRFGTLFMAAVFLITSVGVTVFAIWQTSSKDDQTDASVEQLETPTTNPTGENLLEGSQLAGFTPTSERVAEVSVTDIVAGSGQEVKKGDSITAHYTGALVSTGIIFQSSLDTGSPFTATLLTREEAPDGRGLIAGWVQGIPGMKVGGQRRLVIPAALAYGAQGSPPSIPADADLVFDIELVSVQ